MSVALDYVASASSILEYLLTVHPYRWEIAQLSNQQIERLRIMLDEAVDRITPEQVYEAITRGFDQALGVHVSSPPLATDMRQGDANTEMELMEALLREISPAYSFASSQSLIGVLPAPVQKRKYHAAHRYRSVSEFRSQF